MSYSEMAESHRLPRSSQRCRDAPHPRPSAAGSDAEVRMVLENGIREIAGEVRNSLDFHRSQEGGGEVSRVVLSGAALDIPGFAEALQAAARRSRSSASRCTSDEQQLGGVSPHRLAIAAGLAVEEAPR